MTERSFFSRKAYADPFNEVTLDVAVTTPGGRELLVPAFWAGGQTWRVRYTCGEVGLHRYRTRCSDPGNADLHGVEGYIEVRPYEGDNPLLRCGPLRVSADGTHFEHADGSPMLWLADTWWMGLCRRLRWPEEFQALAADRRAKGFNVIQIVAGLYPDMPAFDERGKNEAGFPWRAGYSRINPAYFDRADVRLGHLVECGLVPCIVGAWGYHLPWMGDQRLAQHWRYLVARYGAWPVVWCLAGEANMPYYLSDRKNADRALQSAGWTRVAREIRRIDPFGRPLTVHPSGGRSAREMLNDAGVLHFDMLQTGHGDRGSLPPTVEAVRKSVSAAPRMPVINGEVCYEGILDTCGADVQRLMAWTCLLSGTAGHTYGANGIWQVNRAERPFGNSPTGTDWGQTPWDEAMSLPGSTQVGLAVKLLREYPWHRFEPHPEWATLDNPVRTASDADVEAYLVPYAAGIPSEVRIIYLPTGAPATVQHLEPGARYRARYFDPTTGDRHDAGTAAGDAGGAWRAPTAPDDRHDWVLLLDTPGERRPTR